MQHGLHILRSGTSADIQTVFANAERCACNLASKGFFQFCVREVAQSAGLNHLIENLDVIEILLAIEGGTTKSLTTQNHLIFLQVGLLQQHFRAIRKGELGVTEEVVLRLFLDGALLRQNGHQRLVLHIVHIGLNLGGAGGRNGILQTILRGIDGTFFLVVEVQYNEVGVLHRHEFLNHHVDTFQRQHRHVLLHRLVSVVDAGDGFVGKEVLHILVHKLAVVAFVFVRILLVKRTGVVGFEAVVLGGCETELGGAASLGQHRCDSGFHLSVLGQNVQFEGVNGLREHVLSVASRSLKERALGLLGIFAQAVVEHREGSVLHVVGEEIDQRTLQRVGEGLVLHHDVNQVDLLLLVFVDDEDGLCIVGNGLCGYQRAVLGQHDGREERLDFLLYLVHIHITHDDDALIVGTIPFLVIGLEERALEVVDDFHQSDGHAVAVF